VLGIKGRSWRRKKSSRHNAASTNPRRRKDSVGFPACLLFATSGVLVGDASVLDECGAKKAVQVPLPPERLLPVAQESVATQRLSWIVVDSNESLDG
jgi:hypothetical protein